MRFPFVLNSLLVATLVVVIFNLESGFQGTHFNPRVASSPGFVSNPTPIRTSRFRPTSIALNHSEDILAVASSNGEIAIVDAATQQLRSKFKLGENLSDITRASANAEEYFLTVDRQTHQLIKFTLNADYSPEIAWRVDVCKYPSRITVGDHGLIAVAGHWSRQVSFVVSADWNDDHESKGTIDLEFVPDELAFVGKRGELLVTDAFSNRMAIINPQEPDSSGKISPTQVTLKRELPDRRVGGLSVSNGRIVLATQMLNPLARSTRNDVHWGLMVSNDLEWFPEEKFLSKDFNFSKDRKQQPIGGAGDAKSDAECVVVTDSNLTAIALGGAKQVAIGNLDEFGFAYIYVGRRPVDLAIDENEEYCFVANQLDGSVSVIRIEDLEVSQTIELDENRDYSLAEQGERLFFDASVSHDGWMSCNSCHVDGHTNGLINDNLSDETFGTPKRVLSLLGHGGTEPMSWSGNNETLEDQVRSSIKVTMQSDHSPTEEQVNAISAFVRELPAPPSLAEARGELDVGKIEAGRKLFHELDCVSCHSPPHFTSPDIYEVGLEDEKGESSFNPPSLIGLGQRDSFFHDSRVKSLEEVFTKIEHQLANKLPDEKLSNLLAFLKSL